MSLDLNRNIHKFLHDHVSLLYLPVIPDWSLLSKLIVETRFSKRFDLHEKVKQSIVRS